MHGHLAEFLENQNLKSIQLEEISMNQLSAIAKTRENPFHLLVVGLSSADLDPMHFYNYLLSKKDGVVEFQSSDLEEAFSKFVKNQNTTKALNSLQKLESEIRRAGVALPLFQTVRSMYYPKHIKGIELGEQFFEVPRVAKVEL